MRNKDRMKDYIYIIIGTVMVAVSVTCFYEPNGLVTGGVTGIAIIIANLGRRFYGIEIPLWFTNIILNVPLFLAAFKINGKAFIARTLFATVFLTIALSFTAFLPTFYSESDLFIYSVFGAVFSGIGMGLVFRCRTTTGGTDLLASLIHKYVKHISMAKILFSVDTAILCIGFLVFGTRSTMYALLAGFIASRVTDTVLEGFDFAKAAFIISDKQSEIAKKIMSDTERGATSIHASGVYTGKEKNMLMIVMNNKEIVLMKEIVVSIDPTAFVIVTDVREVLGEGFGEIDKM